MREFVVKENKLGLFAGIFSIAVGIAVLVLPFAFPAKSRMPLWLDAIYLPLFAGPGIYLLMADKNRRLEISGRKLCYVNFLNKKKEFSIDTIGYVKEITSSGHLILYDKKGNKICKIENNMSHIPQFLIYLSDNGITVEMKGKPGVVHAVASQKIIVPEEIGKYTEKIGEDAGCLIEEWTLRNREMGAAIQYGFAEYRADRLCRDEEVQPEEAVCRITRTKELPEDYLCVLELYVKKEDKYIRNKKGSLVMMAFTVIYGRKSWAADRDHVFVYNGLYKEELEEQLTELERYLPKHRFTQEEFQLPHPLKKSIKYE